LSAIAREVDHAFLIFGIVTILMLLGITVAMIYFVIRYSRKRTRKVPQIHGNLALELTWIIIPTIIVVWMFFVGYRGFEMMRNPPDDAMIVNVTARQWAWEFSYPDDKITSSEMYVPVNTPVKAVLSAPLDDVLHAFYLPDFRVKEDVVPGKPGYVWFKSDRVGTFNIFCAEFCGMDHSKMLSRLHVLSAEDFKKWKKDVIAKRYKPLEYGGIKDPKHPAFGKAQLNIDAKKLYGTYCASCHGATGDGSGLPDQARDFRTAKGWRKGTGVGQIYDTLMTGIPGSQMRPYPNFTPWERVALAHQVRSFHKAKLKAETEGEYKAMVKRHGLDKIKGPKESIPVERAIKILAEEAREGVKQEDAADGDKE